MLPRLLGPLALLAAASISSAQRPIEITFLHTNDLHAHIEPTVIKGKAYGGYARLATLIAQDRKREKNVVLLNAGDTFQGTLYFNVYEGLADAPLLNLMGYDAGTLGNHEFDKGTGPTTTYADALGFPLVAANLKFGPNQAGFASRIKPSVVLTVAGQRVGVVGIVTPDTPNISSPGEGVEFLDPYASAQAEVDRLTAQGINKIVLLTHIGYD
ncbi:multifunctional 2',3'-cyclic-nucleotide 2'-phosphodiesterase/5'-nucleotidase/3'-nucleotidase, partial [bacterium]